MGEIDPRLIATGFKKPNISCSNQPTFPLGAEKHEIIEPQYGSIVFHVEFAWSVELKGSNCPGFHLFVTRRLGVPGSGTAFSVVQIMRIRSGRDW